MKRILPAIFLMIFGMSNAQRSNAIIASITKNSIRKTNLTLNSSQAKKVQNSAYKGNAKNSKSNAVVDAKLTSSEIAFFNDNAVPVKIALGSNDIMNLQTIGANEIWKTQVIDDWQNVILRTDKKEVAYNIKTQNCFTVFWNNGYGLWDLKKAKCADYISDQK